MAMEDVLEKLRQERDQLTLQIDMVDQMIAIARGKVPRQQAQVFLPAKPRNTSSSSSKKNIAPETLSRVKKAIEELVVGGELFVNSIPGSFSTKQVKEKAGVHEGTARKAIQKLIDDGQVTRAERLSWRELGDKPQGRTDVFVLNAGQRRQWRSTSEEGAPIGQEVGAVAPVETG